MARRTSAVRSEKAGSVGRASGVCACAHVPETPPHGGEGVRRAVYVDPAGKSANLKQLRRIEGQVRGIAAMIEQERYCADIITQVAAVRESLHSVARSLMKNHVTHCAAHALTSGAAEQDAMIRELLDLMGKLSR
ncbi:MAG TPA: metal-sensitive transcriptional regulator [Phycisphaerales bacterium]|nr:metal-sensitive transcriptional regulator [Phycisphaerales bacterium]